MNKPQPRLSLSAINPYVPGKTSTGPGKAYKLSSNESALGPAPSAMKAFEDASSNLHIYPDGSAGSLRQRLAMLHDLDADHIIVGNGSDEVLSMLVQAFSEPGDEVLMTRHGFSYYPLAAMAEGCTPVMADERDLTADIDLLLEAVTEKTRILFLANPNNPTGTLVAREELERLRHDLRDDILLVLDAAYAEYITDADYDSGLGFVREAIESGRDNVAMTRTFSKIYGLGGLRVGWGYAAPSVIDMLNRVRGPFNVNAPALAAAEAALGDQDFVIENREHNAREMERMVQSLRGQGVNVRETRANFILAEFADEAEARGFLQHCESRNVYIRGLASSNMPGFVRISIGDREANDAFLAATASWLAA